MITLKSAREIALMREAGKVVVEAFELIRSMCQPGVRTLDIDRAVEELFRRRGAEPLFKGVQNGKAKRPFPAVTCISINEQVVHGIPSERRLKEGDIVSVDTGCRLNGWCADSAMTIPVGNVAPEVVHMIDVAKSSLAIAIREMRHARKWSQVARVIEDYVHSHGYSLVEEFVGHGIGRDMHEEPQVPNFVSKALLKKDFWLEPGLVIAVEPMVNLGKKDVRLAKDQWTVETKDGRASAHFEHTIAMSASGPIVLTEGAH